MKKQCFLALLLLAISMTGFSQQDLILTFSGVNNTTHVQLDSVKLMNRTQNCDTVIFWPDTVFNLSLVGISEMEASNRGFRITQNYPNPVDNETVVSIVLPESDEVNILISDITGKSVIHRTYSLEKGIHEFRFTVGSSTMYVFSATGSFGASSTKIVSTGGSENTQPSLTYSGFAYNNAKEKSGNISTDFFFVPGDELLLIGYHDAQESGMADTPELSREYMLQFAYNIPCPGNPTLEYGGQVYNTVQIFNQCWLKENLNYAAGNSWCYEYDAANCDSYGRLYDWETAISVCPVGWHLPTDEEWKILEGATDSQYPIGDAEWDNTGLRGFDAGKNMKSATGWNTNGNGTDLYGFSALPGGYRFYFQGNFFNLGDYAYWWTSDEYPSSSNTTAWGRRLFYGNDMSNRWDTDKGDGRSVRCLKD